jgi:hypothetical protein
MEIRCHILMHSVYESIAESSKRENSSSTKVAPPQRRRRGVEGGDSLAYFCNPPEDIDVEKEDLSLEELKAIFTTDAYTDTDATRCLESHWNSEKMLKLILKAMWPIDARRTQVEERLTSLKNKRRGRAASQPEEAGHAAACPQLTAR